MDNTSDRKPLVEIQDATKLFDAQKGIMDTVLQRDPRPVRAVDNVNLTIHQGEVVGIAGESGCGKTTLGKLLVKLHDVTSGAIRFDGRDLSSFTRGDESEFRKQVQMIFQDPFESLNPRMTVLDAVSEPLRINDMYGSYQERRERVIEVLEDVELAPADQYLHEFPKELSGGERQRVSIARALVVDPEFIVADEPVSMLDVSIRASVLNLMKDLRSEYDLTYVFISHDLSLIRYMCDRTAIMYLGDIIEIGDTDKVVNHPQHPYTRALFNAVPVADPSRARQRADVTGEVPSARNPPSGCKFHPRCPEIIPPDDWSGDQDGFRRIAQFKYRISNGQLTLSDLEIDTDAPTDRLVDEILRWGLVLDVPEEHLSTPGERNEGVEIEELNLPPDAIRRLREAAEYVIEEQYQEGYDLLDESYQSVCETTDPGMRSAGEQETACHLYDAPTAPVQRSADDD